MPEGAQPGGTIVQLGSCGCGRAHLMALRRPLWARLLFPFRKRYRCLLCGVDQLQLRSG